MIEKTILLSLNMIITCCLKRFRFMYDGQYGIQQIFSVLICVFSIYTIKREDLIFGVASLLSTIN